MEDCTVWLKDLDTKKIVVEYFESFEMRCWRRIEETKWSEKVNNEKIL
jgi:hypothetical protein